MTTTKTVTSAVESPIKVLIGPIGYLQTIASTLVTTSILTDKDEGLRAKIIRCACMECGAELSESAIANFSFARAIGEGEEQELSACSNCAGTSFEFRVRPESPRHWVRIKERLAQIAPGLREPEIVAGPVKLPLSKTRWMLIAGAMVIGIILFFVMRYWIFGSPIPLIHQPESYDFKETLPVEETEPKVHKARSRDELEDEK